MTPRPVAIALVALGALAFAANWVHQRAAGPEVVVYCSLDPVFSREVLSRFEAETGIRVRDVQDTEATKTTGLVERIRRERSSPRCDVLWSNEPLRTIALAEEGLLLAYEPASAAGIPSEYRDPAHRWTGFAARARVVAFDPASVDVAAAPRRIEDLLDPRFRGRVAIADPRFGTTGSHFAALLALWGEERFRRFLEGLVENSVQVVGGNSASRDRVLSGEATLALTDTDDVEVSRRAGDSIAEGFFPDEGTVLLPNTVAIVAGAPNPAAARALVEWLLRREVESELAASPSRQVPLRPEVMVPASGLRLADVPRLPVSLEEAAAALPRALEIAREVLGL
jgi:iron(III) transport system substrate-binding protein